jgi:hypothetical protein
MCSSRFSRCMKVHVLGSTRKAEAKRHVVTTYRSAALNQEEWDAITYVGLHQGFGPGEGLRKVKACDDLLRASEAHGVHKQSVPYPSRRVA